MHYCNSGTPRKCPTGATPPRKQRATPESVDCSDLHALPMSHAGWEASPLQMPSPSQTQPVARTLSKDARGSPMGSQKL